MSGVFDPQAAARTLLTVRGGGPRAVGLPATPPDTSAAYVVQALVMAGIGGPVSWKMALLGGRDRHTAPMPATEIQRSGAVLHGLPDDAAIEVETALILGTALDPGCTPHAALDGVAEVRLAFEMVGSRYADRTSVPPLEAMADSFSSAGIVLGDAIPDWRTALDRPLGLRLMLDGQLLQSPEQAPTLADTADFLAWLATHAAGQGMPLTAGCVIITGARIGPLPLNGARQASATCGAAQVMATIG